PRLSLLISTLFPYTTLFRSHLHYSFFSSFFSSFALDLAGAFFFGFGFSFLGISTKPLENKLLKDVWGISTNSPRFLPFTTPLRTDRKSTRLNSSHVSISYSG